MPFLLLPDLQANVPHYDPTHGGRLATWSPPLPTQQEAGGEHLLSFPMWEPSHKMPDVDFSSAGRELSRTGVLLVPERLLEAKGKADPTGWIARVLLLPPAVSPVSCSSSQEQASQPSLKVQLSLPTASTQLNCLRQTSSPGPQTHVNKMKKFQIYSCCLQILSPSSGRIKRTSKQPASN
jgi:hypothetical protein